MTLTAGNDSRALLAASLKTDLKFKTFTGSQSTVDIRDRKIPKLLSKKLGIEHIAGDVTNIPTPHYDEIFNRFARECPEFLARNWILLYKEFVLSKIRLTRIMGYGGEFYTGFYDDIIKNLERKLWFINNNFASEVIKRVKISINRFMELSERDARDLFYQRERDQFWVGSNVNAYIKYFNIFTPFKDPKLVSLGYRYKGGIRKTNIHHHIISTLPRDVQKIPINYPYLHLLIKKIKQKYISRELNFNYLIRPSDIINKLNLEFFSPIINENQITSFYLHYKKSVNLTLLHKLLGIQYFFNAIQKPK